MNDSIFDEMLDCYEAGTPSSIQQLNQLLKTHDEERRHFVLYLMEEDLIADELKIQQVKNLYTPVSQTPPTENPIKAKNYTPWYVTGAVAATFIVCLSLFYLQSPNSNEISKPVATLKVSTTQTQWIPALNQNQPLALGEDYKLVEGSAHLEFSNGVQLSVQSPANLKIINEELIFLKEGKVRAYVPESGHGFRIHTPDIAIKDLGTEFGVEVNDGKDTQVHVFNGEIELYPEEDKKPIHAYEGYAAKWTKGHAKRSLLASEKNFPTKSRITETNWQQHQNSIKNDPTQLLFLDFEKGNQAIPSINNPELSATCANPLKVRGRWHRSSAYFVENLEQAIRLPNNFTIEGDFTMQAWINPEAFESSSTVIVNTERFSANCMHWQIDSRGVVRIGNALAAEQRSLSKEKIRLGQWNQTTVCYDSKQQKVTLYINGIATCERDWTTTTLDLNNTYIGAWHNPIYRLEPRTLNGRVDEFWILNRKMSAEEIRKSYEMGLPYAYQNLP